MIELTHDELNYVSGAAGVLSLVGAFSMVGGAITIVPVIVGLISISNLASLFPFTSIYKHFTGAASVLGGVLGTVGMGTATLLFAVSELLPIL